jgi:flagellar protein FlaG
MRDADRASAKRRAIDLRIGRSDERVVVRLVDATTKEVLRHIPTKDALAIARALSADAGVAGLIRASA